MESRTKRHILVFTDWFEPGYRAGGPIRSVANMVDRLDDLHFSVITRNNDHHDESPYQGIEPGVWIQRNERVRVMYLSPEQRNRDFISKVLEMGRFDAVYLNSLFSPQFTLLPLRLARKAGLGERIVLAPRGMLKAGALSVKARKKKLFLLAAKVLGLYKGVTWHATNETEKKEIRAVFGKHSRVKVAPNLLSPADLSADKPQKHPGELSLVSVSRVSKEKNILESLNYLKELGSGGRISYHIYGTLQDEEYLKECRKVAESLKHVEVVFHGAAPYDQIRAIIRRHHFFYLPSLGENFGHAIAEAFLTGTPVIISDKTPWRELESKQVGWDLKLDRILFGQVLQHCLGMDNAAYQELVKSSLEWGNEIANKPQDLHRNRELFRY